MLAGEEKECVCGGGYMHKILSCPVLIDNTNAKLRAQGKTNVSRD